MRLILFLDDRGGMLFNRRRQSQDRTAREYILRMTEGHRLLMNGYSQKQFREGSAITLSEAPQKEAQGDDYVLIENLPVSLDGVSEVVLFLWNQLYPSDVRFDKAILKDGGFALAESAEMAGYSHEKITVEIYRRSL